MEDSVENTKSKKTKKSGHTGLIVGVIVFLAVAVGVTMLLLQLFKGIETHESTSGGNESIGSLYCEATNPVDAFFTSTRAQNTKHEIKITFRGDTADKISYTYTGTYETEALAEQDNATLHANYNIYMGEHKVSAESLTPAFSTIENMMRISLFTKQSAINSATANLFFLGPDEYGNLKNYSGNTIQSIYKNQGFSCEFKK